MSLVFLVPDLAFQKCIRPDCGGTADLADTTFACPKCGGLVDVAYDWDRLPVPKSIKHFETHWTNRHHPLSFSGVWRFRELFPFAPDSKIVSIGEGQTLCQRADAVAAYCGMNPDRTFLQYEGMNPSGSFKDNGMSAAFTHANLTGATRAACASTGNTSASLAAYAAASGLLKAIVFVGSGKISAGKLSQAVEHGALTIQIAGDFDAALRRVREVSKKLGLYLVNSVNPFRLEGQKSVMLRVLEALGWEVPDWIVVPGGNLGNTASFGKAFTELAELGLITKVPRLAVVVAEGADTFHQLFNERGVRWNGGKPDNGTVSGYLKSAPAANTLASAIEINQPVNLPKALRALERCGGVVRAVPDAEILDAKAQIGAGGLGCEPASAAGVAGLKRLVAEGVIDRSERVVCILTAHLLKDPTATINYHAGANPFANRAVQVPDDLDDIVRVIEAR